jgi:fatty-acyl-CoA synthase
MNEPTINVGDWIARWAAITPEKTAVIAEEEPITYAALSEAINRLSNLLLSRGIAKGDRVAVLLRNCREYVEIFFAVSRIGAILVPLNWRLALPELEFILRDSTSRCIIFGSEFMENARGLRAKVPADYSLVVAREGHVPMDDLPVWAVDYHEAVEAQPATEPRFPWTAADEDPHIIMYTSGTTGTPKGAVLSHQKTFFNALNAGNYFNLTSSDRLIVTRPLFHSGGLIVEMGPVLHKGGTVIISRRFSPAEILETAARYRVTILELPATVYNFILRECRIEEYDLRSIKCCFTGGERVPVALLAAMAQKGLAVSQIYGLTEASTLFWLPTQYATTKMGSVGKPVFHGNVRIVDDDGRPVPPGQVGEIIVSGPIVMNGYWRQPRLTAEVIQDGWLKTGDLARTDEEGFVYIVDRKKDMFISGGENVYPAEVEKVFFGHPAVADAAVIGVADDTWGEVGMAFVVLRQGQEVDASTLLDHLGRSLAKYKVPKHVEFVESLPKTASGKVLKRFLASKKAKTG